ncbi:hypothetical protein [Marinobacter sp.]
MSYVDGLVAAVPTVNKEEHTEYAGDDTLPGGHDVHGNGIGTVSC